MENIIDFNAYVCRQVYGNDGYKIYAMEVDEKLYPNVHKNKYGNVSITGDMPELSQDIRYKIKGIEENGKYGVSYKIISISADKPIDEKETYNFLKEILTFNQAKELYIHYPNIVEMVSDNPNLKIDLSVLKGIKEKKFKMIKDKIIENFMFVDIINEYCGMLSLNILKKMYEEYKSIETIKKKIKNDPYKTLCRLNKIGFKTADKFLLQMQENGYDFGYDLLTSKQRCLGYIKFLLDENESNGDTYIKLEALKETVFASVPECSDKLIESLKDEDLALIKETLSVANKKTYETEEYLSNFIKEMLSSKPEPFEIDIEKYRKVNGIDLSDDQLSILEILSKNKLSILCGYAGCVDCDTEYFNGVMWKKISKYEDGEKVLQYNSDGTASLVYPNNYYKRKADCLWHFKTKYGLDQCLSDSHNVYYITSKGNLYSKTFKEVRENHNQKGFTGKFITTFSRFGTGIDLTDDEIRLMVAVFADGTFVKSNCSDLRYKQCRFHIKKKRKKERLVSIIKNLGLDYKVVQSSADGYHNYYVSVPIRCKHFPKDWYNATKNQFKIIMEELLHWDSYEKIKNRYSTANKYDADFVQYVFTVLGYRATININDRVGETYKTSDKQYIRKSKEYTVSYSKRTQIGMCCDTRDDHTKTSIEEYPTLDGYEYCFNVPSEMLVLRRNNKIFITGNCGKTQTAKAIINMLEDLNMSYVLLTPTGKSAKVLAENTDRKTSTIHRGLGYKPPTWTYNKDNKLPHDVIIIDEWSMTDIFLAKHLFEAIDRENTRVLLIGDSAQLPSVSCGNVLQDMISCNKIPTVNLNKVFRYSDGGLMNVATKVRNAEEYLYDVNQKITQFGENKDYSFVQTASENTESNVLSLYKKLLEKYSTDDIMVLTAYRKGRSGTINLNNELQKIANKNYGSSNNYRVGDTIYYVGDIVIQNQNNYNAQIYNCSDYDNTTLVANGETGYIKEINLYEDYLVINFDGIDIIYQREDMQAVTLGYAITIHKSQGANSKIVVLSTPSSQQYMLNSNIIYVGITRTKEKCFHIAEADVINRVIHKKENFDRKTLLSYFLSNKSVS